MKRLVIISRNPIIHDQRVKKIANTLADIKLNVLIICLKYFNNVRYGEEYKFLSQIDKYRKCKVIRLEYFNEFQFAYEAFKITKEINPDYVWCVDGHMMIAGALIKNYNNKIKVIMDFHEIFYETDIYVNKFFYKHNEKIIEKVFVKYYDAFVSVSPLSAKILKKDLKIRKKINIVLNAPHRKNYSKKKEIRRKYDMPLNKKIIMFEGVMYANEGIEFLLKFLQNNNEYYFFLVGADRYYGRLDKMIISMGLEKRVKKFPLMTHSEMMEFISAGDIGYIAMNPDCKNHYYTLTNKYFEYLMAGLPMITLNIPANKKFVLDKGVGEVFEFNDLTSLEKNIAKIFNNYSMYRNNIDKLKKEYNWEKQEEKIKKIIQDLNFEDKEIKNNRHRLKLKKKKNEILSEALIIRSAPEMVIDSLINRNVIKKYNFLIQPNKNDEYKNKYPNSEIYLFPKNGFFKLMDINYKFIKKIKEKNKNVVICSFSENFSDKWKIILFFFLLRKKIYFYGSNETLNKLNIFKMNSIVYLLRFIFNIC